MRQRSFWMTFGIAAAALTLLLPALAKADTVTVTWGEQNGPDPDDTPFTLPFTLDAGTLSFTIPAGQQILGAVFTSTFGNSTVPNTAIMDVFVNGVQVGACASKADPCWANIYNPTPFSYTFTNADLSALSFGTVDLTIEQLDDFVIRLGESTLTITTGIADDSPVSAPEPASWLLLGPGLLVVGAFRKRRGP